MKRFFNLVVLTAAVVLFATYSYGGRCHNIAGVLALVPDPACEIETEFPADEADEYLPGNPEERCFNIIGLGTATFRGGAPG